MKSFSIYLSLLMSTVAICQSSVEFNYNDVYIGRNLGLQWKKTISDLAFSAGITYHINRIDKIPIGTFIKKSANATSLQQQFGLQLGLEYFIYGNSHFKAGFFYNNQTSFIDQTHVMYYAYDTLVSNPQS